MKKAMRRRPAPLFASKPPEPLVTAATSFSPIKAHLMRGELEASGIECFLANEMIAAVDLPVSNLNGGVRLQVRASDFDRALSILRALEQKPHAQ